MQNKKPIVYLATVIFLFFYVTVSYGFSGGCSKNKSSNTCKTCTATNDYGNVVETKVVCTPQEEKEFRDHAALATTLVTVNCR